MKTATEYWKERFEELPQSDAEKLAIIMMREYAELCIKEVVHDIIKENCVPVEIIIKYLKKYKINLDKL